MHPAAIIRKGDRLSYIASLEKAQLGGTKNDYLKIIKEAVNRSLNIYLKAVQDSQYEVPKDQKRLLKIGELAQKVDKNNSTIRYWTKEGLLEVAEITPTGHQLYSSDMVDRIHKIHTLKKQRFTLQEIKKQILSNEN